MRADIPIVVRPARESDEGFVLNSWLRSYQDAPHIRWVPGGTYYRMMHAHVEHLYRTCEPLVACNPDDLDQLFGWTVRAQDGGRDLIHYVYVKQSTRRLHVASQLLSYRRESVPAPIRCSHWSQSCEAVAQKHALVYLPSKAAMMAQHRPPLRSIAPPTPMEEETATSPTPATWSSKRFA